MPLANVLMTAAAVQLADAVARSPPRGRKGERCRFVVKVVTQMRLPLNTSTELQIILLSFDVREKTSWEKRELLVLLPPESHSTAVVVSHKRRESMLGTPKTRLIN